MRRKHPELGPKGDPGGLEQFLQDSRATLAPAIQYTLGWDDNLEYECVIKVECDPGIRSDVVDKARNMHTNDELIALHDLSEMHVERIEKELTLYRSRSFYAYAILRALFVYLPSKMLYGKHRHLAYTNERDLLKQSAIEVELKEIVHEARFARELF